MTTLNVAPTKSNLLSLRRQLTFAEEGFDLLEQKRQVLIFELMRRFKVAQEAERSMINAARRAFAALQEATLDIGSEALARAALGVKMDHKVDLRQEHVIGMTLPNITARLETPKLLLGITGTSVNTDSAMRRFVELLESITRYAELETSVLRLSRELKKTQRRCNALSKFFIPAYRETISYIEDSLEERERESFVIHKMIRDRLRAQTELRT